MTHVALNVRETSSPADDGLLLDGQEDADLALDRAKVALEDLALALQGREITRRHFSAVTREIGEGFLRLARAS